MLQPEDFPGVSQVQIYATKPGIISAGDEMEGVVLKGVGQDYNWDYLKSQLVSGELHSYAADSLSEDVLLSKTMAERLQLRAGDDLMIYFVQEPLRRRKLNIHGIYTTGRERLTKIYLYRN